MYHAHGCSLHQSKIKFFQQFCGTKTNINNLCFNIIKIHVGELRCHPYGYNSFPDQNALNPLSPNGDQHQFSPNHIHRLSRD